MVKYFVALACLLLLAGCGHTHVVVPATDPTRISSIHQKFQAAISNGDAALAANNYAQAYGAFTRAIKLSPMSPQGYEGRGIADYNLGYTYFPRMRQDFSQAIKLRSAKNKKQLALDYYNLGEANLLSGHDYAAIDAETKASRLDPSFVGAYAVAGSAYTFLGSQKQGAVRPYLEAAVQMYLKVIHLSPTDPRGYVNLGIAYANLREYSNASDMFSRAIVMNPTDAFGWFNRGLVEKEWGKKSKALTDLRQAYKLATNPSLKTKIHQLIHQLSGK